MLKSKCRYISFFSESILRNRLMNNLICMRFQHKVKHVKGDAKLEPESVDENVTIAASIKPHCAFIARAQVKLAQNAKRKYNMKRSAAFSFIMGDGESSSVEGRDRENIKCCNNTLSLKGSMDVSDATLVSQCDGISKHKEARSSSFSESVNVPSDFRKWELVNRKSKKRLPCDGLSIKVLSYNVLAQCLLESHPYLYRKCPPNVLKWECRMTILYKEICEIDPDVICLQEVQESHLKSFYNKLDELGYRGIYKKRTGIRQDGCAIYYKYSLFELLEQSNVEFFQPELQLLNRDNIGLMVKLAPRSMKSTPFVVATTHLLYNPKRVDVRLAQMQVFLAEIDRFSYCETGSNEKLAMHWPIIMTGDLNSIPSSPVHSLVTKGQVGWGNRDLSMWMRIAVTDQCQHLGIYLNRKSGLHSMDSKLSKLYNSEKRKENFCKNQEISPVDKFINYDHLFNSGNIEHSLALQSVYNHIKENDDKEATTFQDFWLTVDYIFYSTKNINGELILQERLRLPTENDCSVLQYLPNNTYGSDHLALAATFLLKPLTPISL